VAGGRAADAGRRIARGEGKRRHSALSSNGALRELEEETGLAFDGPVTPLPPVKQKGGKLVRAWAAEGDFDPASLRSATFEMEWPPKSGRRQRFPEVDRAAWFDLAAARGRINSAQAQWLEALAECQETQR